MTQAQPTGWQEVQVEVLRRIQSREWAPGDQIPNESDLAQEFGVARATVNRALRALAEEGLLERRRRAGTRVAALPVRHARLRIPVIRQEIEARGQTYGYALKTHEIAAPPRAMRALFDAPPGKMLHLVAVHLADGAVHVHEDRWINTNAIPAAANADFARVSANEWLVGNAPISTGEIVFQAQAADAGEAALFGCVQGDALFRAERTTWHEGQPVTFVRQTFHPGYRLSMQV